MTEDDKAEIMTRIKMRCITCPECDGLKWDGTLTPSRVPVLRYKIDGRYHSIYVRRFLLEQKKGHRLGRLNAITRCQDRDCVDEAQLMAATSSQRLTRAHERNGGNSMATRIKIAQAKRAKSKLTDAGVQDIRTSDEHRSVLMDRYGITEAYYYMVRRGQFRMDHGTPFSGLISMAANQERKRA